MAQVEAEQVEWINLHPARQAELLPIVGATDREIDQMPERIRSLELLPQGPAVCRIGYRAIHVHERYHMTMHSNASN